MLHYIYSLKTSTFLCANNLLNNCYFFSVQTRINITISRTRKYASHKIFTHIKVYYTFTGIICQKLRSVNKTNYGHIPSSNYKLYKLLNSSYATPLKYAFNTSIHTRKHHLRCLAGGSLGVAPFEVARQQRTRYNIK